ncbi:MAG: hypothetical protein QOI15_1692 [Pseudonocardiales bacterium]|nr:hypothetical protein [Pseudonocardiales bacterium]
MNIRISTAATLVAAAVSGLVACSSGGGLPTVNGGGPSGRCSDPNPSYLSLTFAAVVCVDGISRVQQPDGSTELVLTVAVTNKDPNTIHVTSTDFDVLDVAGQDVAAEDAVASGRAGVRGCVSQDLSDDGWPLAPGKSFTPPGPLCFNLAAGEQSLQLVWQGDVSVPIAQP